jgi:hypothetical protein
VSNLTLSSNETVAGQNETFLPEYRDNGIPIHCLDFTSETTLPHSAAVQTYLGEDAAKRLAACWNVCDGISTEDLEIIVDGGENFAIVRDRFAAERAELLAALEIARDALENVKGDINPERGYADELEADVAVAFDAASAAIAAAKVGAQ